MNISPTAYWGYIPFKFSSTARANTELYGSTVQLLYFQWVDVVGGVILDAPAEYFCESWDFDVAAAAVPEAIADEATSILVAIVTVVLEVGVVVMVTVVLEVRVGGASREFLVVRFFFGGLALFFRGAPLSRFFKSPVMRLFFLSKECCIVFRGTAGVLVIFNTLGDFFFIIFAFASRCVSIYAVILVAFLEVPCCLCCASRGFPGSYGK